MPRQARVVAVGAPHPIAQRGNNRQDIFLSDEDRRVYLDLICEQSQVCELALLGYCLMTNHVHLVAIPRREDSLAHALRRAHSQYSQWFSRRYRRSGHLWQSRFFARSLDRDHLVAASVKGSVPFSLPSRRHEPYTSCSTKPFTSSNRPGVVGIS